MSRMANWKVVKGRELHFYIFKSCVLSKGTWNKAKGKLRQTSDPVLDSERMVWNNKKWSH